MADAGISRRTLVRRAAALGGLALLPGALAACGEEEEQPASGGSGGVDADWPEIRSREVVVAGFGGLTYQVRRQIAFNDFTQLSGARVVEAPWDYGKFVAMVDSARPEWDMIDFDGFSMIGLLEAGEPIRRLAPWVSRCDLVDRDYRDYAAGSYAYSVVLGWTDEAGGEGAPRSWSDFFDTERFPGRRAFPRSIYAGTLEIALLADGVPREQIYPIDFDRAFEKLDTIKDTLLFYDSYAQGQQYITQGSAAMIVTANSRAEQLKTQGSFDYTFQDSILYPWGAFPMPRNAPHVDAANAFIDYLSAPEAQAEVARRLQLGPIVSAAFDQMSDEELAKIPNSPANREACFTIDTQAAAEQDADYATRYADWVAA